MQLLMFVLASYGLTLILLYGSIFNSIRPKEGKLGDLFKCPLCMGFWTGVLILFISPWSGLFTYEVNLVSLLIMGWLSAGTSYFLDMVVDDYGFKVTRRVKND
jgi:hypothetical protein